jgi:hypothetical protein
MTGSSGTEDLFVADKNIVTQEVLKAEKSYVSDKDKKLIR